MLSSRMKHVDGLLQISTKMFRSGGDGVHPYYRRGRYHINSNYSSSTYFQNNKLKIYCKFPKFHAPRSTFMRPLSSSPSPSNENDIRMDSLDSYLFKLRSTKRLTVDEAQSIKNALSNLSAASDVNTSIIHESIDAYISMNKRRVAGGQAIENPGLYVRSIVRRQLMEITEKSNTSSASEEKIEKINEDDTLLQPLFQSNDIKPNELTAHCILALSQCPKSMADEAIKAYIIQKKKREMNGKDEIANPSSYVMGVLRNLKEERTASQSPLVTKPSENDGVQSISVPVRVTNNAESDSSIEISEQHPNTESSTAASNFFDTDDMANPIQQVPQPQMVGPTKTENARLKDSSSTKPNFFDSDNMVKQVPLTQRYGPSHQISPPQSIKLPQTDQVLGTPEIRKGNDNTNAVKVERVTTDYVEECLECLVKLEQPIKQLKGVGQKTELAFNKIGIYTLRDLLWHFPRSFIDRSKIYNSVTEVSDGDVGTFRLTVKNKARNNSITCTDEAGNIVEVSFFYGRSRQGMIMATTASKKLASADTMIVSGKIKHSDGKSEMFNPDTVIHPDQTDSLGIEAVYPLSSGLTQKRIQTAVGEALEVAGQLFSLLPESLSDDALEKLCWPRLADALIIAHKPTAISETGLDSPARQRIAFEELTMQQAQLALAKWKIKKFGISSGSKSKEVHESWRESPLVSAAISTLPFSLTSSQEKCLDELWDDAIKGDSSMFRILNGDVGSGKTIISFLLGLGCIEAKCGKVVSMLCPTQLLAAQHVRTISDFANRLQGKSNWSIRVELLTGSIVGKQREELLASLEGIKDNEAVFLIGTHALTTRDNIERLVQLQDKNKGVALAVVDEEQRFGVRQRQALTSCASHFLSMSATPIPRSISLQRSGLMDLTLLESEPRSVETTIVSTDNLPKVLTVLQNKVEAGSKCFWVVPRIEGNTNVKDENRSNVIDRYEMLAKNLGGERCVHIHGKMSEQQREENLERFSDPASKASVLVATSVIEGTCPVKLCSYWVRNSPFVLIITSSVLLF